LLLLTEVTYMRLPLMPNPFINDPDLYKLVYTNFKATEL